MRGQMGAFRVHAMGLTNTVPSWIGLSPKSIPRDFFLRLSARGGRRPPDRAYFKGLALKIVRSSEQTECSIGESALLSRRRSVNCHYRCVEFLM